ncbi:MAG TPA: Flp family type IVb pilin [Methylovirgula sp.]|jgi:pilus assembly protein Flp/PilA
MITRAFSLTRAFLKDETAATAIEYGLIAAFIAVVIISSVRNIGTRISAKFTTINNALS